MKMRLLLAVFLVSTFANIKNVQGKFDIVGLRNAVKGFKSACMKASGVSEEIVAAAHAGEYPPVQELKCYWKCMFQKMKGIKDGKFSTEMLKAQTTALIEPGLAAEMLISVDKCGYLLDHDDLCEGAYLYGLCCLEDNKDHYFFP